MNRYHFSIGNSRVGPVGYCAEVDADTQDEAIATLRSAIEEINCELSAIDDAYGIRYLQVYLNPNAIKPRHIDEVGT
jgi:hypothetical protein